MAKSFVSKPDEKKSTNSTPSQYGSHSVMLDQEKTEALGDPKLVVLKDEKGFYTTERNRLDTGLADPNRYALSRDPD
jgi:hypothetical protein